MVSSGFRLRGSCKNCNRSLGSERIHGTTPNNSIRSHAHRAEKIRVKYSQKITLFTSLQRLTSAFNLLSIFLNYSKLFVGNLDWEVRDSDLEQHFREFKPMESHVKVTTSGRSRGFAILSFKTHEAAASALSLNGTCLRGRVLEVRQGVDMSISRTRLPRKRHFGMRHRSNMEGVHSNVCFVNNLSLNSTDDDVCNMYTR